MSETQQRRVGAYVVENPALHYLYIIGAIGIVAGLVIAIVAAMNLSSYAGVNSGAAAFKGAVEA